MKNFGWVLLGLVLGFLAGGVRPRAELAVQQDATDRLQDDLVKASLRAARCTTGTGLPGLSALLPGLAAPAAAAKPLVDRDDGPVGEERREEGPTVTVAGADDEPPEDFDEGDGDGEDVALAAAVDAQRIRAEQSRAALADQADLSDDELAEVDSIVTEMNGRLGDYADELLSLAESEVPPSPRELLGLTHDVTGILVDAQEGLEETVGEDRMGDVDPEASAVWNYLDLGMFEDLMQDPEQ